MSDQIVFQISTPAPSSVEAISTRGSKIDLLATNIAAIDGVYDDINGADNVGTVAADLLGSNYTGQVAGNIANVNIVAGMNADIAALYAIRADIEDVADIDAETIVVAGIAANVTTVATNFSDIKNVADIGDKVVAVSQSTAAIGTVAANILAVNTLAANIMPIYLGAYFTSVEAIVLDSSLSYTEAEDKIAVTVGQYINAGPYQFEVAASDATDNDEVTAGGVKLYALPSADAESSPIDDTGGYYAGGNVEAALQEIGTSSHFVVRNYTELAAVSGDRKAVYVLGRSNPNDGGQGSFIFVSGDQSANVVGDEVVSGDGDGGIWVAPASDLTGASGAYRRVFDGRASAKWYGAIGNGVADDTDALQAMFSSGVKYLHIPPGTYRISGKAINLQSDTNVKCEGKIIATDAIPATSFAGAITLIGKSNFYWDGGEFDFSGSAGFDNNIFLILNCTNVEFRNIRGVDANNDRFPLGPFRSTGNTRLTLRDITVTNCGGIAHEGRNNQYSRFTNLHFEALWSRSAMDVSGGNHNYYCNNTFLCASNTVTSSFSFNDKYSVCQGNTTNGGAFGITVGHAGNEANYSTVFGNICESAASIGINIQATKHAAITGNVIVDTLTGLTNSTGAGSNTITGNVVKDVSYGIRASALSVVVGNLVSEASTASYQPSVDNAQAVHVGNGAFNGTGVGFRLGVAPSQVNNIIIGNFAADNQATPTQTHGFTSLSSTNLLFGNATDGNHTVAEFSGTYSSIPLKDLSDTTEEHTVITDGGTGGTGSAGSGNQYVELKFDNVTYKILHDGTL